MAKEKDILKEGRLRYTYGAALNAAQRELAELMLERAEIDKRIARLKETITSLTYLSTDASILEKFEVRNMGLTEAVQYVLQTAEKPMTPVEIRDELALKGYDISKYTDFIPSLHTILKRLFESGRATKISGKDKVAYAWIAYQPSAAEMLRQPKAKGVAKNKRRRQTQERPKSSQGDFDSEEEEKKE